MKKHRNFNLFDRNASQLSPWQSQVLTPKPKQPDPQLQYIFSSQKVSLPQVPRIKNRISQSKLQKVELQIKRQNIGIDKKEEIIFKTIEKSKENTIRGFLTKYKSIQSKKNKYVWAQDKSFGKTKYGGGQTRVNFINLSKTIANPEALDNQREKPNSRYLMDQKETQRILQTQTLRKSMQLSRKKSIYNDYFIKLKIKQPYRNSPWLKTERVPGQHQATQNKNNYSKTVKLAQLNLSVRHRNLYEKQIKTNTKIE